MTLAAAAVELEVVHSLLIGVAHNWDPYVVTHLPGNINSAAFRCKYDQVANDLARCGGERNESDSMIV